MNDRIGLSLWVLLIAALLLTPPVYTQRDAGNFRGPVGLELYSLRRELDKDVPGTLARVREFGFTEVEVAGLHRLSAEKFREELDKVGLKCVSMMAPYERLRDDLDNVAKEAKLLGAGYVVCAWIPHQAEFTEGDCRRAASDFNRWGERLTGAGLQFGYHPHGYEFRPHAKGTLLDLLVAETGARFVTFEMDVFWVVHGGGDPAALLRRYPRRFSMMHLKDMRKGTPTALHTGNAPDDTSVTLGTGQVDFPAVLREAVKAGVKHYFIEDESVEAIRNIPASLEYLRRIRL